MGGQLPPAVSAPNAVFRHQRNVSIADLKSQKNRPTTRSTQAVKDGSNAGLLRALRARQAIMAVASISILARSSTSPATTTIVIAGK